MLAAHDRAGQVDRGDAVEGMLGDAVDGRIAARNTDTHIVMQDIDAIPTALGGVDHGGKRALVTDIRLERHALALPDHASRLFGTRDVVINREHLGTLLGETQNGGAPVSHALARGLPGANHDRDLVLEAHVSLFGVPKPGRIPEAEITYGW